MILSASRMLTEVTPVTYEPLRLGINFDPEMVCQTNSSNYFALKIFHFVPPIYKETCQVDDESVPEEIGMSAIHSDGVITLAVRFDANDLKTQSITSSNNS